jgi:UDP-N-acetylmuramyl tripeptide synthase
MKIIAVTGTKGKTTVVRMLADILHRMQKTTLRVDTTGYYINEEQKADFDTIRKLGALYPTVAPGRFIIAMQPYIPNFTAVLEASLGCSRSAGLGYSTHDVGIFTNVYEDHLDQTGRLQTRQDIAVAKNFIFKNIRLDKYAVFNADDELVVSQLDVINPSKNIQLVPVGLTGSAFDVDSHIKNGGIFLTVANGWIIKRTNAEDEKIIQLSDIVWTFNGQYQPSVYNALFVIGGLYGHFDAKLPSRAIEALKQTRMDRFGGRLTQLKNKNGVNIIVDYAHEKKSLREIGELARTLASGKTIGVVRLSFDRTDEVVTETGKFIANDFDELIIYDKIDGHFKSPKVIDPRKKFVQVVGHTSQVLYDAIHSVNQNSVRIVREDEAITQAAKDAQSGDVVVVIAGDDITRSVEFVKKYFEADFI